MEISGKNFPQNLMTYRKGVVLTNGVKKQIELGMSNIPNFFFCDGTMYVGSCNFKKKGGERKSACVVSV
jgi:hypothetical protein